MENYATVEDVAARIGRVLTPSEEERAEVLLGDATALIASMGFDAGDDEVKQANAVRVVCAMVIRALSSSDEMLGVSQYSQTAGPYSMSFTPANSGGDLYLTKNEKRSLGVGVSRVRYIGARIGRCHD